jgi:hypothetical protein
MPDPIIDALTQRLNQLERRVRWCVAGTRGALLIAVALLLLTVVSHRPLGGKEAIPRGRTLEVERLVIRDASGKVRAVLGVETPNRGWPGLPASMTKGDKAPPPRSEFGLFLYDASGPEVVHLTDWGGVGALLQMSSPEQQTMVSVMAQKTFAQAEVSAREKDLPTTLREMQAVLERAEREHWTADDPRAEAFQSPRAVRAEVAAVVVGLTSRFMAHSDNGVGELSSGSIGGSPVLALADQRSKPRAVLELDPFAQGAPRLELFDENWKKRVVIGRTALEVTRTGAVTELPESSLVLFDKDGRVLWKTP